MLTKTIKVFVLGSIWLMTVGLSSAQVPVELKMGVTEGDTIRVEISVGTAGYELPSPISSFQFQVVTLDTTVTFLDLSTAYSLTERDGWTVRANPANGKVGGFSSSTDAIKEGGTLLTLLFIKQNPCDPFELGLDIFKLNSGTPAHEPEIPAFSVSACEEGT